MVRGVSAAVLLLAMFVGSFVENKAVTFSLQAAMQRYDDAIDQFEKALHLNWCYEESRINLGIALAQVGDLAEAMGQLEMVLDASPESVSALESYVQTQWLLGEYEQARCSFNASGPSVATKPRSLNN